MDQNADISKIELLLKFGADPNKIKAIFLPAISHNSPELIQILLDYHADPYNGNKYQEIIEQCIKSESLEILKIFFEQVGFKELKIESIFKTLVQTPNHFIKDVIKILFDQKVDLNFTAHSALYYFINNFDILSILLDSFTFNVNSYKEAIISFVSSKGTNLDILSKLINYVDSLELIRKKGKPLLIIAIINEKISYAEFLITKGAIITKNHTKLPSFLQSFHKVIKWQSIPLIKTFLDVIDIIDYDALIYAIQTNSIEIIKLFKDKQIIISPKKSQRTLFSYLSKYYNEKILDELKDKIQDAINSDDNTLSDSLGNKKLLEYLIDHFNFKQNQIQYSIEALVQTKYDYFILKKLLNLLEDFNFITKNNYPIIFLVVHTENYDALDLFLRWDDKIKFIFNDIPLVIKESEHLPKAYYDLFINENELPLNKTDQRFLISDDLFKYAIRKKSIKLWDILSSYSNKKFTDAEVIIISEGFSETNVDIENHLKLALMSRSFQIADYLLGKIDLIPNYLFGIAIEARSLEFVQNLLKKQNLPENISNGRSLLFWIIIHYDKDIFSLLVKHVTDFQEQFTYNETLMNPLIFAISLMRGKECIQILIDKCLIHDYSDVLIKTAEMAIRSDEWYYNEILELLLKFKPIDHEIEMKIFQFAKANNNQDLIRIMLNSDRNNIVKSILEEKNYKLEDEYGYRYISSNEKIHSEVFLKLKRNRFDIDGFDENGFDTIGFDRAGFDNEGFNRNGFDKDGFGRDGFNKKGFNRDGYDKFGYDKYGYDTLGYDRNGYNIDGYDRDGFGRDGYDMYGYDSEGFGRDGYNRGDIYKYDSDYYHSRNSRRRHYYGMYDYDNDRFYDFY